MRSFLLLLVLLVNGVVMAQEGPYAPYGGVFTPKGTLRVLLVFVVSQDAPACNPTFRNADMPLPQWSSKAATDLPNFVDLETGAAPPYLFLDEAAFSQKLNPNDNNFSKEFYNMSGGNFRLIGEVFKDSMGRPTAVVVDPTGARGWMDMNQRAIAAMNALHPNWNGRRFDQRRNLPNFAFDNSLTRQYPPDKALDFVVFIHRYNKHWKQQPNKRMPAWIGSGGGFANTGVRPNQLLNGYRTAEGFTMSYESGVFVHEVAHVLFNAPHIMGVNNVVGHYFDLLNAGWGVMAPISLFGGFNGWERWYSGLTELVADVPDPAEASDTGYVLRDYYSTGDALRIALPHSGGQHLWLEYHAKIHPQDQHPWEGKVIGKGDTIGDSAPGVYAYVEAVESDRHRIFSALSPRANGIHVLHAGGNYDYRVRDDLPLERNDWGNPLYSFERLDENPFSGINPLYRYPYDHDGNGVILLDQNYNKSGTEYFLPMYREAVAPDSFVNLYGGFGVYNAGRCGNYCWPIPFQDGGRLDYSTNPKPLNYPVYNPKTGQRAPYVLNGLTLRFEALPERGAFRVWVGEELPYLNHSERWTGPINLVNLSGDEEADLTLGRKAQLILDRSQTPNTHLQSTEGDFVHPTVLTLKKGTTLHLKRCAELLITNGSTLIIEDDAKLIMEAQSRIIIDPTGTLVTPPHAIVQHKRAKVVNQGKRR